MNTLRLSGAIVILLALASPALAAEQLRWNGVYVGVNGGYGQGSGPVSLYGENLYGVLGLPSTLSAPSTSPTGGLFGLQAGYNWQPAPHFVLGVETDIDLSSIGGSGRAAILNPPFNDTYLTSNASQRVSSLGTVRARVGYAAGDWLLYGTGGLAYGRTHLDTSLMVYPPPDQGSQSCAGGNLSLICTSASSSQWSIGWVLGGGVEWAWSPKWSVKGEYLHYDLGSVSQSQSDPGIVPRFQPVTGSSVNFRGDIVRVGLNYKIN